MKRIFTVTKKLPTGSHFYTCMQRALISQTRVFFKKKLRCSLVHVKKNFISHCMGKISRLNKYVNFLDRDKEGHTGLEQALERTAVGLGIRFAQLVSRVKHDFRFGDAEKKLTAAATLIIFCAGFPLIAAYQAAVTICEAADLHQDMIERNTPPD